MKFKMPADIFPRSVHDPDPRLISSACMRGQIWQPKRLTEEPQYGPSLGIRYMLLFYSKNNLRDETNLHAQLQVRRNNVGTRE